MYLKGETPVIKASIFYYDADYYEETAAGVFKVLEKYNMHLPQKLHAGKLTDSEYVKVAGSVEDLFVQAYCEKDVLGVDMLGGDEETSDYWRVEWSFTFYKLSKLDVQPAFMPWNVISLYSTYERLRDQETYSNYFACFKELISVLKPFYASIDDVDNKVKLAKKAHIDKFTPDRIQQIYWGNYWGEKLCHNTTADELRNLPVKDFEVIENGVLFFLTDNVFGFDSSECKRSRRKVKKYFQKSW